MANEIVDREQLDDAGVWTTTEDGERVPDYDATFPTINEGEVVHGTVVRVDKDEVLVDIGYKSEGVIPVAELSIRRSVNPADEVSLGDEVDALVLTKEDTEGRLILSKKRARFEMAWKAIEQAAESGEPVNGRVIEVVKGGLILDLGVRGFLPASLVDIRRVQDLDEFLGQDVKVKVLDIDRERQRISLGLKQTQSDPWQQVLETYHEGDTVEGKVTKVVTFGAFVEILPGVEGLVHISELAQHHVENPREVVSQGDLVSAKIIEVDAERRRLSLSLKRIEGGGVTERADDSEAIEGTPNLDLSEEVFPEAQPLVRGSGQVEGVSGEPGGSTGEAAETPPEEAGLELPVDEAPVEEAPVEEPAAEEPAAEEPVVEPAPEETDASIEADQQSPETPGPGDSEGEPPAPPD